MSACFSLQQIYPQFCSRQPIPTFRIRQTGETVTGKMYWLLVTLTGTVAIPGRAAGCSRSFAREGLGLVKTSFELRLSDHQAA